MSRELISLYYFFACIPVEDSMKPFLGSEELLLDVQGLHFNALAVGPHDGELVLFLHGFPQFADAWLEVMHTAAEAGFRAVAVDQRGYSPEARPQEINDYTLSQLTSDIGGFVEALGRRNFHLVGHDWGALLAWNFTAAHPDRILSLCALSTPHTDAFLEAMETDEDQKQRSKYITLFRMSGEAAETLFEADNYQRLRAVYQGKVSETAVNKNIHRLAEPYALTSVLNWYRALDLKCRIGKIEVPTLYIWGSHDLALGETAATATAAYVTGAYRFEKLEGRSHWLLEEVPHQISMLVLGHLCANLASNQSPGSVKPPTSLHRQADWFQ